MSSKSKIGMALTLIVLVLATAPAVQCLGYLYAQSHQETHSCCPQKTTPADTAVPTCCIHSPAVTSQSVDAPAPIWTANDVMAIEPSPVITGVEEVTASVPDTSPPLCNSILRI